jgi:hypothetical protein
MLIAPVSDVSHGRRQDCDHAKRSAVQSPDHRRDHVADELTGETARSSRRGERAAT